MRTLVVLCWSLAMLLVASPVQADPFAEIRARIPEQLLAEQVPSLAVAVSRHGEILWEEGFGWADREQRRAASHHTLYSLASISKPITATGLMLLAERGLADLDRPANDYLGLTPLTARTGDAAAATLRRLANHTAGLPLHYQFFYADELHRPPMAESIRRYGQLMALPGEAFHYANFGYGLLDEIIARNSGQTYAEFMRREVFLPLGLTHMSVDIGPGLEDQQAVRYASDQTPLPFYDFDHPGGSAVYASAHDLLRFGMFHLHQRLPDARQILTDETIDRMQVATADAGAGVGYGVGWFINPNEHGCRVVSHSGGMGGVRTRLAIVPEEGIAVVALCNFASDLPLRTAQDILAALVPRYAESLAAARSAPAAAADSTAEDSVAAWPAADLLGTWSGAVATHADELSFSLHFQPDGDVHVRLADQLPTLLNEPRLAEGYLAGSFAGSLGTEDAARRPYHVQLRLRLRGDLLDGAATAVSLPAPRLGNALSSWVQLHRSPREDR